MAFLLPVIDFLHQRLHMGLIILSYINIIKIFIPQYSFFKRYELLLCLQLLVHNVVDLLIQLCHLSHCWIVLDFLRVCAVLLWVDCWFLNSLFIRYGTEVLSVKNRVSMRFSFNIFFAFWFLKYFFSFCSRFCHVLFHFLKLSQILLSLVMNDFDLLKAFLLLLSNICWHRPSFISNKLYRIISFTLLWFLNWAV